MEAFPDSAGAVLDALRAEAEEHRSDLQATFVVDLDEEINRDFIAYVGVDPPVLQPSWEAVLDTGGPEVTELLPTSFLLRGGWEPDDETTGQWYRSWPPDTSPWLVAAQVGLVLMAVLDPHLRGNLDVGITVFEDRPGEGRVAVGDATDAVLARLPGTDFAFCWRNPEG